jgi:hypothetical protein
MRLTSKMLLVSIVKSASLARQHLSPRGGGIAGRHAVTPSCPDLRVLALLSLRLDFDLLQTITYQLIEIGTCTFLRHC